ncbi:MAG: Rieske (2Fe-2S) protein [Flavisolibacter sp.]
MNTGWIKIVENIDDIPFGKNGVAEVMAGEKRICIAKYNGQLYAFPYTCPHSGGYLADGYIDLLGNIVCPLHHYKFCLKNGRNVSGEGYYLKRWDMEVRDDGVFVKFKLDI